MIVLKAECAAPRLPCVDDHHEYRTQTLIWIQVEAHIWKVNEKVWSHMWTVALSCSEQKHSCVVSLRTAPWAFHAILTLGWKHVKTCNKCDVNKIPSSERGMLTCAYSSSGVVSRVSVTCQSTDHHQEESGMFVAMLLKSPMFRFFSDSHQLRTCQVSHVLCWAALKIGSCHKVAGVSAGDFSELIPVVWQC